MLTIALLSLALGLASAPSTVAAAAVDPPVKVWLSSDGDFLFGERGKVYAKTAEDGYLLVLHADARGRIRVLFPLDPGSDQAVKGGKKYEIKGRGNREAFVADDSGRGVVFAAWSSAPFNTERYARNGHWDFRALAGDSATVVDDAEARLADIAQEMKPVERYTYDVATYTVTDASYAYRGRGYPGGGYGPRIGIGMRFGRPHYGRYYDPFLYRNSFWFTIGPRGWYW